MMKERIPGGDKRQRMSDTSEELVVTEKGVHSPRIENPILAELVKGENIHGNGPEVELLVRAQSYLYDHAAPNPSVQQRMLEKIQLIKESGNMGEIRLLELKDAVSDTIRTILSNPEDIDGQRTREQFYGGWTDEDLKEYYYFLTKEIIR